MTLQVKLADYTTIGIGGPARMAEVHSPEELRQALQSARTEGHAVLVLGGGSNMLISDAGWPGLVIRLANREITTEEASAKTRLCADAGLPWDDLVAYAVAQNLQGIECLSGIPGTVGASPIQNIGAYGQEVCDTISRVEAMDRATGELRTFSNEDCQFAYRWSRFKGDDRDRFIITKVAFDLTPGGVPTLRYGDLTRHFTAHGIPSPTLAEVREAVIAIRRIKGMVVDPAIADSRSCGSFFMNPIVAEAAANRIENIARDSGLLKPEETMPRFPAQEGQVKLSAAWLMERAGLKKGLRLGGAGLSSRHVLAIINAGNATAADVLNLVHHVQATVSEQFGVQLHPEPVMVGIEPLPTTESRR